MRKPTRKQKKAVKILLENPSLSTSEIMRQSGYSDASIVDPNKNLLDTKGFQQLMEENLPDWRLTEVHAEGLSAVKTTRDKFGDKYEDPDYYARHAYLETAYKIKGRLNPPDSNKTGDVNIQLTIYGDTGQAKVKAISGTVSSQKPRTQGNLESGMDNKQSGEV